MTIRSTPPISLSDVLAELRTVNPGRSLPISLGDPDVRALAGVPSGPIVLSNLYGKSSYIAMSASINNVSGSAAAGPTSNYQARLAIGINLSGGKAPFTYAWSHVSGDGSVQALNAASSTADFIVPRFSSPGDVQSQVVQCTVTDVTGAQITRTATATLMLN